MDRAERTNDISEALPAARMLTNMRWNLIWYLPLVVYFILRLFWPNAELYWEGLVSTFRHYGEFVLLALSPAFGLWLAALHALCVAPFAILIVPFFFQPESTYYPRRYLWSFLLAASTYGTCLLLVWVILGSWPFLTDGSRHIRIRTIPFIGCNGCEPIQ